MVESWGQIFSLLEITFPDIGRSQGLRNKMMGEGDGWYAPQHLQCFLATTPYHTLQYWHKSLPYYATMQQSPYNAVLQHFSQPCATLLLTLYKVWHDIPNNTVLDQTLCFGIMCLMLGIINKSAENCVLLESTSNSNGGLFLLLSK